VFEYTLRQYVANDFTEVRKLYKESLMEWNRITRSASKSFW
jgi:hypothetical protein